MNRRELLSAAAALAFVAPVARAGDKLHVEYSREAYEQAIASGKPLLLDFYTEW